MQNSRFCGCESVSGFELDADGELGHRVVLDSRACTGYFSGGGQVIVRRRWGRRSVRVTMRRVGRKRHWRDWYVEPVLGFHVEA